jgi:hypothetical protein
MTETVMIAVVGISLVVILLWILIGAKGKWWLKAPLCLIMPLLATWIWLAAQDLRGWPSIGQFPQEYMLYKIKIEEPTPNTDEKGAIFLVIEDSEPPDKKVMFGELIDRGEPRVFKRPYTRQAHEQAAKLQGLLKKHGVLRMSRGNPNGKDGGGQGGKGNGEKPEGGSLKGSSMSGKSDAPFGYILPPPVNPRKETL